MHSKRHICTFVIFKHNFIQKKHKKLSKMSHLSVERHIKAHFKKGLSYLSAKKAPNFSKKAQNKKALKKNVPFSKKAPKC